MIFHYMDMDIPHFVFHLLEHLGCFHFNGSMDINVEVLVVMYVFISLEYIHKSGAVEQCDNCVFNFCGTAKLCKYPVPQTFFIQLF